MTGFAVDSAVLLDAADLLGEAADRLAALAAGLPAPEPELGPDDLVHALEDSAHQWQHALRAAAVATGATRDRLRAAAAVYEGVEALVSDWSAR